MSQTVTDAIVRLAPTREELEIIASRIESPEDWPEEYRAALPALGDLIRPLVEVSNEVGPAED